MWKKLRQIKDISTVPTELPAFGKLGKGQPFIMEDMKPELLYKFLNFWDF